MFKELRRLANKDGDESDNAAAGQKFDSIAKAFNKVKDLRDARLKDVPGIRKRYDAQVRGELGVRHGERWTHFDQWEAMSFSKFKTAGRMADLLTEMVELGEHKAAHS